MLTPERLSEMLSEHGLVLINQRKRKPPAEILAKAINKHLKGIK